VVVVLALVGAVGGLVLLSAQNRYDQTAQQLDALIDQVQGVDSQRATHVTSASAVEESAARIAKIDMTGFVDTGAATALAGDLPALTSALDAARDPLAAPDHPQRPGSLWPPTLDDATRRLQAQVDSLTTQLGAARQGIDALTTSAAKVTTDQEALLASVATVSAQVDATNDVATNDARFAFEDAATGAGPSAGDPAGALVTYVDAGRALVASQAAEQAELAGALHDKKVAIEQFARSIDGGVRLDFTWKPTLTFDGSTWGLGGSSGGWTEFWFSRGGYATISLTDSVAAQWPSSKALVVHEVGHAISTKCESLAPHDTRAEVEAWAVAWAISMGYTGPGNGADLYGTPPSSLVQTAATCR
jgi:prefoldin subunit 5